MKKFAMTISYLPFCGKILIRNFVFGLYGATTHQERTAKFWPATLSLVLFIFAHGFQAGIGIEAFYFNAPIWVQIIFGLYAAVNICVLLTQSYLLYRITIFFFSAPLPRVKQRARKFSGREVLLMFGVTFGGQSLVLVLLHIYQ